MKKVSISIVSYGSGADITQCISSLKKYCSFFDDLDIYIINNKIDDTSICKIAAKHDNVKYIQSSKNGGYGYGHNQVINNIKSDYHVVLNPDIIFKEDTLAELLSYMEANRNTVAVTPQVRNTDNTIQHLPKKYPRLRYVLSSTVSFLGSYRDDYTITSASQNEPIDVDLCTGCFMFIRTAILKKVGGFDDAFFMYFEDFDLSLRLAKYGTIVYFPLTYVVHKWNRESKKSFSMFWIQVKSMMLFYKKWRIVL